MDVRQEQDGVWKTLFHRQTPQVEAFACQEYLDGSATLRLPDDRIPSLEGVGGGHHAPQRMAPATHADTLLRRPALVSPFQPEGFPCHR